jgi:hypothetical protein
MVVLKQGVGDLRRKVVAECHQQDLPMAEAARRLGMSGDTLREWIRSNGGVDAIVAAKPLTDIGYRADTLEMTPEQAWAAGTDTFDRVLSKAVAKRGRALKRPKGPVTIFHSTDEHVDDNATPLRLIEHDIAAAKAMGAVMCHGGDLLNNWPMAGKLAKQWAEQDCPLPAALLRAQHFMQIFDPDVATMGNHEEMNPYLAQLLEGWMPKKTITDYWTVRFDVETPGGRPVRAVLSHKLQKGSSWFHKLHGHIREMLEAEEVDLLMDGHVHSDGVLEHTLPERMHSALAVASAGYKVLDKYAARISRGGKLPKIRGRAHWIVFDTQAEYDETFGVAFKSPRQAEAYLNGLQNLRAA